MDAGGFAFWLSAEDSSTEVPCGECRGCCRSSMFIHIQPEERETLRRIPRKLTFAAPCLPKGHRVMGHDDHGRCPMLIDGECSIYEHRPRTCRDYDCRVFAATGVVVEGQPEIAGRVSQWAFTYETEESRAQQAAVKRAAAFLRDHNDRFPPGRLPRQAGALAALAIRLRGLFADAAVPEEERMRAILAELGE